MPMRSHAAEAIIAEPTLGDELAALADEDIVEMTNLQEEDTGIPGVIFVSTAMGSHGPRVKYFLRAGRDQPSLSVSISENPKVLASSLSQRDTRRVSPLVLEWVKRNHERLLTFWDEGETWSVRDVVAFVEALEKV